MGYISLDFEIDGLTPLHDAAGNEIGPAGALPHFYFNHLNHRLEEFLAGVVPTIYRGKTDYTKPLFWHFGTPVNECYFKRNSGEWVLLKSIKVEMLSKFELREVEVKHYVLGDAQVSMADVEVPEGKITFDVVQQVGEPTSFYITTPKGKKQPFN